MPDLIRMKALKPWRNTEHEGVVSIGQEFDAVEDRARELERNAFAERIGSSASSTASAPVPDDKKATEPPVEFARKEHRRR